MLFFCFSFTKYNQTKSTRTIRRKKTDVTENCSHECWRSKNNARLCCSCQMKIGFEQEKRKHLVFVEVDEEKKEW